MRKSYHLASVGREVLDHRGGPAVSAVPSIATGAAAFGALALGGLAVGALSIGLLALGRVTIGRLLIRLARVGKHETGSLKIGRIESAEPIRTHEVSDPLEG